MVNLQKELRACLTVNIDMKLEHYANEQSYLHVKAKESEVDFCRFLGLMVAKVLLNNRLGQFSHNFDIFVSIFDILNDKGVLGIAPQD